MCAREAMIQTLYSKSGTIAHCCHCDPQADDLTKNLAYYHDLVITIQKTKCNSKQRCKIKFKTEYYDYCNHLIKSHTE